MRNKFSILAASISAVIFGLVIKAANAQGTAGMQSTLGRLGSAGAQGGYSTGGSDATRLITTIALVINIALGFLGVIFLALMVYAGFIWMTAGGDEGKVETSRHTITRAVIGLLIVLSAYAIANFIVPSIYCATNPTATGCSVAGVATT